MRPLAQSSTLTTRTIYRSRAAALACALLAGAQLIAPSLAGNALGSTGGSGAAVSAGHGSVGAGGLLLAGGGGHHQHHHHQVHYGSHVDVGGHHGPVSFVYGAPHGYVVSGGSGDSGALSSAEHVTAGHVGGVSHSYGGGEALATYGGSSGGHEASGGSHKLAYSDSHGEGGAGYVVVAGHAAGAASDSYEYADYGGGYDAAYEGGYGGGYGGDIHDIRGDAVELAAGSDDGSLEAELSAHEDQAALSAVGLANLLTGGGGLGGSHAHLAAAEGSSYTISGPTQEIKSVHKIQTTNAGGHVLSHTAGHGAGRGHTVDRTIVVVKQPVYAVAPHHNAVLASGYGWH